MGRVCRDSECYRSLAKNSTRNKNKIQKRKDDCETTFSNGQKARAAIGGGPVEKLKAGEEDLGVPRLSRFYWAEWVCDK